MEQPVPHLLGFTKFRLRQFSGIRDAGRLDLDRALADFRFCPFSPRTFFMNRTT
jgi:hypothetical protein